MNWKFWTWPAQIRALEDNLDTARSALRLNTHRMQHLEDALGERLDFEKSLLTEPLPREQAYAAFEGVTDETPWWRMVHCVLQKEIATEQLALAQPALASEQSHFNRGRLARLLDLQAQLHSLREAAQRAK